MTLTPNEQAAADAGYVMPEGGDLISQGDEAIRVNAVKNHREFASVRTAIQAARFPGGAITSQTSGLDAFVDFIPGKVYSIGSREAAAGIANMPEEWPGPVIVYGNPGSTIKLIEFHPYNKNYYWRTITRNAAGTMGPWQKFFSGQENPSSGDGLAPYAQHTIRQAKMMHDLGGPIDTAGRGAVAFRIDHGFTNFRDKLLPLFRSAGIVPMITYNPRDWDRAENAGVTPAEVNGWVANGWVEISNHAATHSDATGTAAITDAIVGGLQEIEQQLPAAAGKVYGFCVPGVGGTGFDGFIGGSQPEQWDTHAGRLILQHHAVGYGALAGTQVRVLDGTIRDGMNHVTMDSASVSALRSRVDEAISKRGGLQLMIHPSLLDTEGRITTAQFGQVLDYIVQQRAAGSLLTLSSYQMMVADATMSERDTGSLTVTGLFSEVTNGQIYLRRVGNMVHVTLYDVEFGDSAPPDFFYLADRLPVGYRPAALTSFPALAGNDSVRRVRFQPDGRVLFYTITASTRLNLTASYLTPDSWPS